MEVAVTVARVAANGGNRQRRQGGDLHVGIDQHLRLGTQVVIDLVSVASHRDLALEEPLTTQPRVALQTVGIEHTVLRQSVQVQLVGAGAVDHQLDLAHAVGADGIALGEVIALQVRATQTQNAVGVHGQAAAALQGEDFHFLDLLHRLVDGEGFQAERGVRGQLERVHARATVDLGTGLGQQGLERGRGHDGVVAVQRIDDGAGFAHVQGVGVRCRTRQVQTTQVGVGIGHLGEDHAVQTHITVVRTRVTAHHFEGDGAGHIGGVGDEHLAQQDLTGCRVGCLGHQVPVDVEVQALGLVERIV